MFPDTGTSRPEKPKISPLSSQLIHAEAYHPEAFNFPYTFETMLPIIPDQ